MKIILMSDGGRYKKKITLKPWLHIFLPILLIVVLFTGMSFYFYNLSKDWFIANASFSLLKKKIAHLDTLSTYLAKQENIDLQKIMPFSIEKNHLRGRLAGLSSSQKGKIESLEREISHQESKFELIKSTLKLKQLEREARNIYKEVENINVVSNFTKPVPQGHTTSSYGPRKDPINGKHKNHKGIDVAAKEGTEVHAIASGFITFAGRKGGYGKVLEINHSDSLKSRYAHLHSYHVKQGEVVYKGDVIAKVGSTGRVTGPHLHLEVWKNGQVVNPTSYLKGYKFIEK